MKEWKKNVACLKKEIKKLRGEIAIAEYTPSGNFKKMNQHIHIYTVIEDHLMGEDFEVMTKHEWQCEKCGHRIDLEKSPRGGFVY